MRNFNTAYLCEKMSLLLFQSSRAEEASDGAGRGGEKKKNSRGEKANSERSHRAMQSGHQSTEDLLATFEPSLQRHTSRKYENTTFSTLYLTNSEHSLWLLCRF